MLNISGYELADVNKPCDISLNQEPIDDESNCFNAMPYINRKYVEIDLDVKLITDINGRDLPKGCYVNLENNGSDMYRVYFNNFTDSGEKLSLVKFDTKIQTKSDNEKESPISFINETDATEINSSTNRPNIKKLDTRQVCRLINRK